MAIYSNELRHLCPKAKPPIVRGVCVGFAGAAQDYEINTAQRRALFIAQIAVDSRGFTRLAEKFPRRKDQTPEQIANAKYADHFGNRDETSGDGWRFHGRGLILLRGRSAYWRASAAVSLDLTYNPDIAAKPEQAVRIAAWFWREGYCNKLADSGDVDAVTRAFKGGVVDDAQQRRAMSIRALEIFRGRSYR